MNMDLNELFYDISSRLRSAKDTKSKHFALNFSIFPYIAPDENLISKIIRDLLDPQGNHGQNDIFLQKFFDLIGKPDIYKASDKVNIRTEEYTTYIKNTKRRIDILIELIRNNEPYIGIAIENKPKAADLSSQVYDYFYNIKKRYPICYIIYLTQDGRKPSEYSAGTLLSNNKENLIFMSYKNDIRAWLNSCQKECHAEYVRHFLSDFSNYCLNDLDHNTMTIDKTESQLICNYILESETKNRLKIAHLIFDNFKEIKEKIVYSFADSLLKCIQEEFYEYNIFSNLDRLFRESECSLRLSKNKWPFDIKIQHNNLTQKDNPCFVIGISPSPDFSENEYMKKEDIDKIFYEKMNGKYKDCQQNQWWFYSSRCNNFECWTNPDTLVIFHEDSNQAITYFIEEFRKIISIIESITNEHPKIIDTFS